MNETFQGLFASHILKNIDFLMTFQRRVENDLVNYYLVEIDSFTSYLLSEAYHVENAGIYASRGGSKPGRRFY